jgi:hypothetical protein
LTGDSNIWPHLFEIIDARPEPGALRRHRVLPLAVEHWRHTGRVVDDRLKAERVAAAVAVVQAGELVERLARALHEPFLVFKGPEVGAHYPDPTLRVLNDVDVLVTDADRAHMALLASGWREATGPGVLTSYDDIHQTHPLHAPELTLPLELHRRPNWPTWGRPPLFEELLGTAHSSATGVDCALAPSTEHHALLVLAHSWTYQPFERLSQLVDFALLAEASDIGVLRETARRWQLERLLDVAMRTVDSVLLGRQTDPLVVRWYASHLRTLGRFSPARKQLNRYAASFFVTSPLNASRAAFAGAGRRTRTIVRAAGLGT